LAHHVWLAQVNMPLEQWSNVDHAAAIARSLYGKVVLSRHSYESRNVVVSGLSAARPGVVIASSSSSSGPSRLSGISGKQRESVHKYCRMHGKGKHSFEECRGIIDLLKSKGGRVQKPLGNDQHASANGSDKHKTCFKCGASWSPGHSCGKGKTLAICSATLAKKDDINSAATSTSTSAPTATEDVVMEESDLDNAFYNVCTM
ncbi:hypothetical protein EC973_009408, partial [Apophysomyces ossiformis]